MRSSSSGAAVSARTSATGGLMSRLSEVVSAGGGMRRGAQSTSTPFPFDIPVIGWERSGFDDSEMERVRLRTVILHDGWLFKRAQITLASRRWYVLENCRLYSYTRQDYLQADDVDPSFPQFPASIRAIIDLEHCTMKVISKQKLLLEIQCEERFCWSKKGNFFSDLGTGLSSSSKTFTFYAEDDTAFQSWVDVLSRVEAYKKLKQQLQFSTQPRPEPLTLWDLPRESLLRIFCRMPDDKPEFKYFEKKWPPLREEDVMFYRRVVLLLNGSHQRAMDRHKQVALQEWEVNNSWKEVFEHITLNKLTSEPVIEVEYPRLELKLPAENATLVLKVKERMEIFVDYKALPRILLRSLKDLQDLKVERLLADLGIEQWLLKVEPFLAKFHVPMPNRSMANKAKDPKAAKSSAATSLVITTEEDIEFARAECGRGVDIVDAFLGQMATALLLDDGPCCERGLFKKLYQGVVVKLIDVQKEENDSAIASSGQAPHQLAGVDIDSDFHMSPEDAAALQASEFFDKGVDPAPLAAKTMKDAPQTPELFSDWEGGAMAVEPLTFVSFLSKLHGLASALRKGEVDMQSYFGRIYENLLKKDKTSDDIKGFRPSTMKKDEHVQHLPINGHVQTVAYRSLKSKADESARTDAIMQKIASFITVGAFSAHALKFKGGKGYDGELKTLAKLVESLEKHVAELQVDSDLWLKAVNGDEPSAMELNSRIEETLDVTMSAGPIGSNSSARLKRKLDSMISCIWKLFSPGAKNEWSVPEILKARSELQKRRSVSISQALAAFAEVIMNQIKTFYHGSSPDFCVFHEEMGMLDDTYNACRWVIDRRLMIRLKLMPYNLQSEHDSDFFWTLCEEQDCAGPKSSRSQGDAASSYNVLFRQFPCEKKDDSGPCTCRVCRSHPLPQWDEKRVDEDYPAYFHNYRAKATPADFLQPVLVMHVRKKYWDRIPPFVLDPADPTHLRFDYPLFPIFNNVGINENQRRAAVQSPLNFLMQNRVNTDAAAVFANMIVAVEHNFKALYPSPFSRIAHSSAADVRELPALPRPTITRQAADAAADEGAAAPVLIFKKLRPVQNGPLSSEHLHSMEDAPAFDDEHIAAAARWPPHFPGPNATQVDAPQVLLRLKEQIVEACTKCQQACYETRKVTKEMAKRMEHQAPVQSASVLSYAQEDGEPFGEGVDPSVLGGSVVASKDAFNDSQTNLQEPPIEQLEIIGDVARSKLASGRIVMCKSAKDRTSMYVTYDECRFLQEEHDAAYANGARRALKPEFTELMQRMRTDGTRIHNVRKNVHTSTYAFNAVQGMLLPANYKPPSSRMAWGVQS